MDQVSASSDDVLVYFSTEFEIETNKKAQCQLTFPYLGQLIDMVVKSNRKAVASMLKNALTHNQNVLKKLREIGKAAEDSFSDMRQYMNEESILAGIMHDYHFYEDSDTVCFHPFHNASWIFDYITAPH